MDDQENTITATVGNQVFTTTFTPPTYQYTPITVNDVVGNHDILFYYKACRICGEMYGGDREDVFCRNCTRKLRDLMKCII